MPRQRINRNAFTLVELLVVVGIIALLVALLMPVMARVRYQARLVNCASNERQYILAIRCYANDHKGVLPRFDMGGTGQNIIDLSNDFYGELHMRYHLPFLSFYCPESPPKLEEVLFKAFGFFIDGYMIWTPRLNGGQQIPPDPGTGGLSVNGKDLIRGPIRLGDHLANTNPVITDIVLIHNEKVSNPNTFNLVTATIESYWGDYSAHFWKGRLDADNECYLDGHVERVAREAVRPRYLSFNSWNCR